MSDEWIKEWMNCRQRQRNFTSWGRSQPKIGQQVARTGEIVSLGMAIPFGWTRRRKKFTCEEEGVVGGRSTDSFSSLCKVQQILRKKEVVTFTKGKSLLLKFKIFHLTLSYLQGPFSPEFSTYSVLISDGSKFLTIRFLNRLLKIK